MDNKSELFDLKREKRELDAFLSTFTDAEPSSSLLLKEAAPTKEVPSSSNGNESASGASRQELSGLNLEMPAIKTEKPSSAATYKDKGYGVNVNEFIPRFTDAASLDLSDQAESVSGKTSPFSSLDDGKKTNAPTRITVSQNVKPLESFKTMTRFDRTTKSDGTVLPDAPLSEEKKISPEINVEKKVDQAAPYDFTPQAKSAGKSKWIWLFVILLILLLAGYFVFSYKSSIPSLGNLFKTGQGASVSSVKEIKLQNVRQRLVYNVKLGKSIRVVEGIAENSAAYPVSKIKIVANLYDAEGSLLASMASFGGAILVDAKLENMDAAGLIADLKTGKASEDRIPPKGQIPFMVVFTSDVAGVHKLSVSPVDFTKH